MAITKGHFLNKVQKTTLSLRQLQQLAHATGCIENTIKLGVTNGN